MSARSTRSDEAFFFFSRSQAPPFSEVMLPFFSLSLPLPLPSLLASVSVSVTRIGCKARSRAQRDSGEVAEAAGASRKRARPSKGEEESSSKKKGKERQKKRANAAVESKQNAPSPSRLCPFWTVSRASQAFSGLFQCLRAAEEEERVERERGSAFVFLQAAIACCFACARLEFCFSLFFCALSTEAESERKKRNNRRRLLPSLHSSLTERRQAQRKGRARFAVSCSPLSSARECLSHLLSRNASRRVPSATFKRRTIGSLY